MHATASPTRSLGDPLRPPARRRTPRRVLVPARAHPVGPYELAIDQGADLIEPDVVLSRDGALVVRHESELSLHHRRRYAARVRRPPHDA